MTGIITCVAVVIALAAVTLALAALRRSAVSQVGFDLPDLLIIKLVRHGLSESNTGEKMPHEVGDHRIALTDTGHGQAFARGKAIGADFIRDALVYCSPYLRTRQTLRGILAGAGLTENDVEILEDPRLREVDLGYMDAESQIAQRQTHGWFYYRFAGGESPADCYDRTCSFLESLVRQIRRKKVEKVLIVSHGMTIRCFVTRFMHMPVEEFERLHNPENCDEITITRKDLLANPQVVSGRWGIEGLRFRR